MFGHIASALREWMSRENVSVNQLNSRLGIEETNTSVYNFLNAKHAPGPSTRARLVKVTGIPEVRLAATGGPSEPRGGHGQACPCGGPQDRDVLSFVVDGDGMATVVLHARLPLDTAMPLLRMILDAGVVFTKEE